MKFIAGFLKFVGKLAKWMVTLAMAVILCGGVLAVTSVNTVKPHLAHSLDDLSLVTITVKSAIIRKHAQIVNLYDRQAQIDIFGNLPDWRTYIAKILVGDHVGVYVTKEEAAQLQGAGELRPIMIAYGIVLSNGRKLTDPAETMAVTGRKIVKVLWAGYVAIILAAIYFLALLVGPKLWRRYAVKSA